MVPLSVGLLYARDDEGRRLAGSVFGAGEQVPPLEHDGDGLLLDRRRALETFLVDTHQQLPATKKEWARRQFCF